MKKITKYLIIILVVVGIVMFTLKIRQNNFKKSNTEENETQSNNISQETNETEANKTENNSQKNDFWIGCGGGKNHFFEKRGGFQK